MIKNLYHSDFILASAAPPPAESKAYGAYSEC